MYCMNFTLHSKRLLSTKFVHLDFILKILTGLPSHSAINCSMNELEFHYLMINRNSQCTAAVRLHPVSQYIQVLFCNVIIINAQDEWPISIVRHIYGYTSFPIGYIHPFLRMNSIEIIFVHQPELDYVNISHMHVYCIYSLHLYCIRIIQYRDRILGSKRRHQSDSQSINALARVCIGVCIRSIYVCIPNCVLYAYIQ